MRRLLTRGLLLVGLGVSLSTIALFYPARGTALDSGSASAPEIEGTWRTTVTQPGAPPFGALHSFARGGAMFESNQMNLGEFKQTTGQGVWCRTGGDTFAFTFEKFAFDAAGNFIGTVRVTETVTVKTSQDTYTGVATVTVFDPAGNVVLSAPATTSAVRMTVAP